MTAFSIVVPAYNAETTLAAALASADRQTERDFEVVVVNDGSSDGTGELADRLCADRPWRAVHQANRGLPAARNAALSVAKGRWIALLDSDDWLMPGFLARMRTLLESRPGVGLAFADAWIWDEARRRFARPSASGRHRPRPVPTEQWELFRTLSLSNYIFITTCFPRDLVLELGGFNEALRSAEDWELWLRIVATGAPVVSTDERLAIYRHRPGQMSRDNERMWTGQAHALQSVRERCELPPQELAELDARIARHLASTPGDGIPRSPLRDLAGRATRWMEPVRDFRMRAPREVTEAFGELR